MRLYLDSRLSLILSNVPRSSRLYPVNEQEEHEALGPSLAKSGLIKVRFLQRSSGQNTSAFFVEYSSCTSDHAEHYTINNIFV